jgi:hypothetical protein
MTVKTCSLVLEDVPPDNTGDWSAVFYRNPGVQRESVDATPPYRQIAGVTAGTYLKSSVWTKAGQPTVTRAPVAVTCP